MCSRSGVGDDDEAKPSSAAQLLTESPASVTASLTEAQLHAAGLDPAGPRLLLPKVLSWMQMPGGGGAGAAGMIASGGAAVAEQQADTRPLPPIGGTKAGRLPRVASWRDVLEIGSSSSSRLRELGESCLHFGRASAGRSISRAVSFCRPVSLPSSLAELGAAQHARTAAAFHPKASLYAAHEALLELWLRQKDRRQQRAYDPLSTPRVVWRWVGVWLLLIHICLMAPAAWVRYRCEHSTPLGLSWDPACEDRGRSCPALLEMIEAHLLVWRESAPLPPRYKRYGCRREAMAELSGLSVRLFSASEVLLRVGLKAAAVPAARRHSLRPRPSARSYRVVAQAAELTLDGLLALDVVTLLPPLRRALASLVDPIIEAAKGVAEGERRERDQSSWLGAWGGIWDPISHQVGRWEAAIYRQVGEMRAVRTVAAYMRVKQLPPPPGPWTQYLLEEVLLKWAIGPGLSNAIRALPTIGDVLAEAELADSFFRHFLFSAKMGALLAAAAKAASFRRRLYAVRRQRAARLICSAMRRALGRRAVSRLAQKHVWREVAATLSSSLRRSRGDNYGTSQAGGRGTEEASPRSPRLRGLSELMGDALGDALKDMGALLGGEARTPRRQQSAPQLHHKPHGSRWEDNQRAEHREHRRKRTPPLSPSAQPAHGLYSTSGLYALTAVEEGSPRASPLPSRAPPPPPP